MSKRLSVKQAKLLSQHRYILKKLASISNSERKKVLKSAPQELFKVLNIIFEKLSKDQLPLSKKQAQTIHKHKRLIRSTSDLKSSALKRKLQSQSGGALPAILSAVLPILGSILSKIL